MSRSQEEETQHEALCDAPDVPESSVGPRVTLSTQTYEANI